RHGGSNPSLSAISIASASHPWRYFFVFDQPRPVAGPGRAISARPLGGVGETGLLWMRLTRIRTAERAQRVYCTRGCIR
ncbi:MAG: hypothetical protein WD823_00595, partial [Sulfuricaulis sp.]|uniref:hypothetical protein n=1 Tax=Sulfuricaulis sp. TaxID=2003553 RepID=UPI0034A49FBC